MIRQVCGHSALNHKMMPFVRPNRNHLADIGNALELYSSKVLLFFASCCRCAALQNESASESQGADADKKSFPSLRVIAAAPRNLISSIEAIIAFYFH